MPIREFLAIFLAWLRGEGPFFDLLAAWWSVVRGDVRPDDRVPYRIR